MENVIVLDNGGATFDRYTIVYLSTINHGVYFARSCSETPNAPNGVGCSIEVCQKWVESTEDKILTPDLYPEGLKTLIKCDLEDLEGF